MFTVLALFAQENDTIVLQGVSFQGQQSSSVDMTQIDTREILVTPTLTGSITDILKTLPYVSVNTELSSQYMVRGGNFDENLVYVNGIEVYRPMLIRAGQQEGLSFLNPQMAATVNFSAGGWEAKYGDRMSSVLDVVYQRPSGFGAGLDLTMMGGNFTVGHGTQDGKFSALLGMRYLNRNLILNTLNEDTEFNPQSYDIQASLHWELHPNWSVNFLGNLNNTLYEQVPNSRSTNFGTLQNPINLTVFYQGREEDRFLTKFGALSVHHRPNYRTTLTIDAFSYHSIEEEYFDIQGAYLIRSMSEGNEGAIATLDAGGQYDHARNDLDMLVTGIQHRGKFRINADNNLEWGFTVQKEDIRDMLNEWQLIDSAGYNITPFQPIAYIPGQPYVGDLNLNYNIHASNQLQSNRMNGYVQYARKWMRNGHRIMASGGLRATYWDYNQETNISPRMQISWKPNWVQDHLFRVAVGVYYQPPFYKELRNPQGDLMPEIRSQRSIHFITGHDFEFQMMDRPFKITTELYYKSMSDLIPYFVDNVRIRYSGENNAIGRAYGIDMRLYGEFIPGADSWLSVSYARVQENINDRGWISRPTDPRFKASLFFQDYMPAFPTFKVSTTLVYASGLPNGAPIFTDPYAFQSTLPDYKRVDIGLWKQLVGGNARSQSFLNDWFKEMSIGLDVFNVFNIRNTVSNQWIRDVNTQNIYGVPNRLTGRFLNAKLIMRW
ncbi:MAG: TonB-dependent receptor plug domain-containing protein [Weeksellaceae bacterium]|nr:TonB-dependent receptor plug domain-containing protein [Weeksellaceae bacterium]